MEGTHYFRIHSARTIAADLAIPKAWILGSRKEPERRVPWAPWAPRERTVQRVHNLRDCFEAPLLMIV